MKEEKMNKIEMLLFIFLMSMVPGSSKKPMQGAAFPCTHNSLCVQVQIAIGSYILNHYTHRRELTLSLHCKV